MSSAIQETADRLTGVEEELGNVRRELAEQRIVVKQLLSRVDATAAYYEQRVDLIYRRVSIALREMMGYGNIDSVSELEAEAVLSKTMRTFDVPFSVPEQLRRAVSGELLPGRIESPLSLHGFRVNRRRARETGTGIEMYGNETGIAIYGPYKLLRPGEYEITAPLERSGSMRSKPDHGSLVIDVFGSEKQISLVHSRNLQPPASLQLGGRSCGDTVVEQHRRTMAAEGSRNRESGLMPGWTIASAHD
jgi:hypothetical protein